MVALDRLSGLTEWGTWIHIHIGGVHLPRFIVGKRVLVSFIIEANSEEEAQELAGDGDDSFVEHADWCIESERLDYVEEAK